MSEVAVGEDHDERIPGGGVTGATGSGGRFTLDHFPDRRSWPAVRFGIPWNGFATPVVTEDTLRDLLDALDDGHRWEGSVAVVWSTIDGGAEVEPEFEDVVRPDAEGLYDLRVLGWTFERI